jgi:hypothetical protein
VFINITLGDITSFFGVRESTRTTLLVLHNALLGEGVQLERVLLLSVALSNKCPFNEEFVCEHVVIEMLHVAKQPMKVKINATQNTPSETVQKDLVLFHKHVLYRQHELAQGILLQRVWGLPIISDLAYLEIFVAVLLLTVYHT